MAATTFDGRMERLASGGRLTSDELGELCATPDVLSLGMLADAARRRLRGTRVTYLRAAFIPLDHVPAAVVPAPAREIRLTGVPESLGQALGAIASLRSRAGDRIVTAFSWLDIERLAEHDGEPVWTVLTRLRHAGLDRVGELPLDAIPDASAAFDALRESGFDRLCVGVQRAVPDRLELWWRASRLQEQFACIQAISPLPTHLRMSQPTTGYDDVKMVAAARLAAPNIASIQVDWQRYGPKLAQVALTFGADDLWGVSSSDEAPEGRRRAPVEEIRRNIEAAGFEPVERDGAFGPLA
jgi:aminodeoxyfutalosine synthase